MYLVTVLFMLQDGSYKVYEDYSIFSPVPIVFCTELYWSAGHSSHKESLFNCYTPDGETTRITLTGRTKT